MSRLSKITSLFSATEATSLRKPFKNLEKNFLEEGLDLSKDPYKVTALELQKKRDDKLEKYMPMLHDFMAKRVFYKLPQSVDFDSLNSEMDIALADELTKFYTTNTKRFSTWWKKDLKGKEYRDLHLGPIILKALNFEKGLTTPNPEVEGFMAMVKAAAYNALRKSDILSQGDRKLVRELTTFITKIKDTENRDPSVEEIAKFMKWDNDKTKQYLYLASLNDTTFDSSIDTIRGADYGAKRGGSGGLDGSNSPELIAIKSDMMEKAKKEIIKLPTAQRNVLELYVYDTLSYKEIGSLLGLTSEEVLKLSEEAITAVSPKLKELYGSDIVFTLDSEDGED